MLNKLKKYPSYKDSDSPWFPSIPTHWEVLPNRYIFDLKKSQVGKKAPNYKLLSLTLNGVIERDMENPTGKFPAEFDTYQEVKEGDFIFCLFDVEETPRTVGLSEFDGMITGAYTVFRNRLAQNAKYLYYFFLSLDEKKRLKPLYKGLRNTISKENFYSFKTPLPPLPEQTAIANFLDKKTAEIKEFITLKEKTIELLKERKMAIINQAVTKGLDPNVEMKDSGIEWLGEIPKHWEVKKLKYLVSEKLKYGANESAELENIEFPRYIRITDFGNDGKLKHDTFKSLTPKIAKDYLLNEGDILFARSGGTVGKTFHFTNYHGSACFAGYLIKASADEKKILSKYLYNFTKSGIYEKWKESIFNQATIQNIGADKYNQLILTLPKISEQKLINNYIENITSVPLKLDASQN